MGFSVSGSAALIFAAMLVGFGMWHTAATNSFERVDEARQGQADASLEERNTVVRLVNVSHRTSTLRVEVANNGSTSLSVSDTDLFVDNAYLSGWRDDATVAGDPETDLWLPGETLTVTRSMGDPPDRVKVVTEHGVAATAEVDV